MCVCVRERERESVCVCVCVCVCTCHVCVRTSLYVNVHVSKQMCASNKKVCLYDLW